MRRAIARQMALSKETIPHYYLTSRADVTEALAVREGWNAGRAQEARISVNDLIVKATALALAQHPQFNGYYLDDGFQAHERINVGVAIAVPDGLIAPAILDCQSLSLDEIALRSKDLYARARRGSLRASEYTSATFTVTNLGMYGVDSFTAIVVPAQVAILAVGAATEVPVLRDGAWLPAQQVALTLSADHRATDGAQGAQFLGDVVSLLEDPGALAK
jgi:pyruvate dehydrogenase E2 component (dihydrolipoamide acetyltransferase)